MYVYANVCLCVCVCVCATVTLQKLHMVARLFSTLNVAREQSNFQSNLRLNSNSAVFDFALYTTSQKY